MTVRSQTALCPPRLARLLAASLGAAGVLALTGCGTVADVWDGGTDNSASRAANAEVSSVVIERSEETALPASRATDWFAAQGLEAKADKPQEAEPMEEVEASDPEAKPAQTTQAPQANQAAEEKPSQSAEAPKTPQAPQAVQAPEVVPPAEAREPGWTYDAFAAEAARAEADKHPDGIAAAKEVFFGEWIEPVPGRANRIQGYRFNPDGTASSVGAMQLKAKRWALEGSILTIWGDDDAGGFTIPFEVQYLVLQANERLLHIREGGGPEMILQKRSR